MVFELASEASSHVTSIGLNDPVDERLEKIGQQSPPLPEKLVVVDRVPYAKSRAWGSRPSRAAALCLQRVRDLVQRINRNRRPS